MSSNLFSPMSIPNPTIWVSCIFILLLAHLSAMGQFPRFHYTYTPTVSAPYNISGFNMEQDQLGRIWVSNVDGVFSYNGSDWTKYSIKDPNAVKYVEHVLIDKLHQVWVCLRSGLGKINETERSIDLVASYPFKKDNIGYKPIIDQFDNIWFDLWDGHSDKGTLTYVNLKCFHMTHVKVSLEDGCLLTERVNGIFTDELANFRIITNSGSYKIKMVTNDSAIALPIRWIGTDNTKLHHLYLKDKAGQYWAASSSGSLYCGKSLDSMRPMQDINKIISNPITVFNQDPNGRIWIGAEKLMIIDPFSLKHFLFPNKNCDMDGLDGDYFYDVFHDAHHTHWILGGSKNTPSPMTILTEQNPSFKHWLPNNKKLLFTQYIRIRIVPYG